jgi:hypothetical protein
MRQIVMNGIDVPTAAAIGAQGFAHEVLLTNLGNRNQLWRIEVGGILGSSAFSEI